MIKLNPLPCPHAFDKYPLTLQSTELNSQFEEKFNFQLTFQNMLPFFFQNWSFTTLHYDVSFHVVCNKFYALLTATHFVVKFEMFCSL